MARPRPALEPVIVSNQRILGGHPVFRGTRVQADVLFDSLADGYSIEEILQEFPTLDREDLRTALRQACDSMKQIAPDVTPQSESGAVRARVP